ncbi:hypothetical protein C660_21470 [Alcaligenes sp. HPC1271]|nr:hypothetical protein C660_21470 [Alcaligenes sp. HPC1271]
MFDAWLYPFLAAGLRPFRSVCAKLLAKARHYNDWKVKVCLHTLLKVLTLQSLEALACSQGIEK